MDCAGAFISRITLDKIPIGQLVKMIDFHHHAVGFRHKLLAMGLTPGVILKVTCVAPLGDPIQLSLRGFTVSLRKKECQQIEVEYIHGQPSECPHEIREVRSDDCSCRQSQLWKNHSI